VSEYIRVKASVDVGQLHTEISADSTITKTCTGVTYHPPDYLKVEFDADLPTAEETQLDVLIDAHVPT